MKLVHDAETAQKEDREKPKFSKVPLLERLMAKTAAVFFTVSVMSCGSPFGTNGLSRPDAGKSDADVELDGSTQDADLDGGHDAEIDGGHDAGPDADLDGGPDADLDGGPDADLDAGVDADGGMEDGGLDAGPDAGPIVCMEAAVGSYTGTITNVAPRNVGGYIFSYIGIAGGAAVFDITCGGMARYTSESFPDNVTTTLDVTVDSKRILVTPHPIFATQVYVTIDVQNP